MSHNVKSSHFISLYLMASFLFYVLCIYSMSSGFCFYEITECENKWVSVSVSGPYAVSGLIPLSILSYSNVFILVSSYLNLSLIVF